MTFILKMTLVVAAISVISFLIESFAVGVGASSAFFLGFLWGVVANATINLFFNLEGAK